MSPRRPLLRRKAGVSLKLFDQFLAGYLVVESAGHSNPFGRPSLSARRRVLVELENHASEIWKVVPSEVVSVTPGVVLENGAGEG